MNRGGCDPFAQRGAGVAAAPAIAAGIISGGSLPAIAATTALQSAGDPENAALSVGASIVPLPVGRAVARILRKLRAFILALLFGIFSSACSRRPNRGACVKAKAGDRSPAFVCGYRTSGAGRRGRG